MTFMTPFVIDHHLIDSINLGGIFLAVLGFFYMTYEYFGRKPLKWFIRVITPCLIGALILFPIGILEYAYFVGFTGLVLRGGLLYALVGGMIGIFNGIFVDWPLSVKKTFLFSWKGCLIGFVIAFLVWFTSALIQERTLAMGVIEGAILAPTGGIAGGLWPFINLGSSISNEKQPSLSWKGCLIGLITAFLFGIIVHLLLGSSAVEGLIRASILAPTGGIAGGLWRYFKDGSSLSTEKPPLFSWKGCLIGLIAAFLFGFVSAFIVDITFGVALTTSLNGALTAAAFIGPAGAITGGISRFIFWRINGLGDGKLGGIGA
ncbi:MAG: hypothetical protein M3Z24_10270, partial [Chloroflexota bacterium]|nr:hypothetical protein [Chloroflexota bacterium]